MCSAPCLRSVFHRRRVIETVSVLLCDEQWPCLDHAFQDSIKCSGNPIRTLPCLSEVPPRPHVIETFLSDEQWSCLDTPMKTASNCLEKPICAPPRLSEVSTTIVLETVSVSITPLKTCLKARESPCAFRHVSQMFSPAAGCPWDSFDVIVWWTLTRGQSWSQLGIGKAHTLSALSLRSRCFFPPARHPLDGYCLDHGFEDST